jgi:phosphopantothenate-cysteine ligase/phosphopantothenoylcysteine decarboxylase/phosphopantothenate--cysteine ligase
MKILVTAGNTQALIDQVRCITNIFSGKTGAALAIEAHQRGHQVTLLTSRPEAVKELGFEPRQSSWQQQSYCTFEDLREALEREIRTGRYDAVIHSAAVSDYLFSGAYIPTPGTSLDANTLTWQAAVPVMMQNARAPKIKSSHNELWLRLTPAPKLIDLFRQPWGFRGLLVKFKLEVGVEERVLEQIAEESRLQSEADLMVANTLEGMHDWAIVGAKEYHKVTRQELPVAVIDFLESANGTQRS